MPGLIYLWFALVSIIRQTLRPVISASQILTRSWLRVRNCDLRSSWFGERDIPDFRFLRVGTSYFAWVVRKRGGSLTTWKTDKQLLKWSGEETVKSSGRKSSMGVCPHRTEMCTFTYVNRSSRDSSLTPENNRPARYRSHSTRATKPTKPTHSSPENFTGIY